MTGVQGVLFLLFFLGSLSVLLAAGLPSEQEDLRELFEPAPASIENNGDSHGPKHKYRKRDILIYMNPSIAKVNCDRPFRHCWNNCPDNLTDRCICIEDDAIPPYCASDD